ncbi:MAG: homoserine dehydrogenase, partial [Pseudomonadota bacterium]
MDKPLKIGIAGLGTVGAGVVDVLAKHGEMIAARAGRPITVTAVSARDRTRDRGFSVADFQWC